MARQRRPGIASMRRRQRNIVEGMGTRDIRYAEAAKRLGVTPSELRKFVESKPSALSRNFNRSASYRKLWSEGTRANVREEFGLKRVRIYKFHEKELAATEPQKYPNSKQIGRMIQKYYYRNGFERIGWSIYTREKQLPNSIHAIRLLHRNGKISDRSYANIVEEWRDRYHISEAVYREMLEG